MRREECGVVNSRVVARRTNDISQMGDERVIASDCTLAHSILMKLTKCNLRECSDPRPETP